MAKKFKTYRVYEEEEAIVIDRMIREIKRTKKPTSKQDALKLIIQEVK